MGGWPHRGRSLGAIAGAAAVALLVGMLIGLQGASKAETEGTAQVATPTPHACRINFTGTVRQGPSAGLALVGALTVAVDPSGSALGQLERPDGSTVGVVGQVTGLAIDLRIDLRTRRVFAIGGLEHDFAECRGDAGGMLIGPEPGDLGDWV